MDLIDKKPRKALGKGLDSLFLESEPEAKSHHIEHSLPLSFLVPNPFQPRIDFDQQAINELAQSIQEQGLLQPIVVRKRSDSLYEIVSGERRFRAFRLLGEKEIPVLVREDIDDTRMLELALVENIQRENLNDIESAHSYQRLLDECGLSHEQLSKRLGKSRSSITNSLRLLKLPESVQYILRAGKISMGHARALLSIENEETQLSFAQKIVDDGLSVRAVESKVADYLHKDTKEKLTVTDKKATVPNTQFETLSTSWSHHLGLKVKVNARSSQKGKVEIAFQNKEEFERLVALFDQMSTT